MSKYAKKTNTSDLKCFREFILLWTKLLFPAGFILGKKETIQLNARQEERIKAIHNENQSLFSERRMDLNQANEQLKALLTATK